MNLFLNNSALNNLVQQILFLHAEKSKILPLYLCNSLPLIKNLESFTEFKGSTDTQERPCRTWPKERAAEQ